MSDFREAAEYVVRTVRELGCDASESSRFAQMRDLLCRRGFVQATDPDFEQACEALCDILPLEFAFRQLRGVIPDNKLREKVNRLAKDPVLPKAREPESPGRNAQTELIVAGICQSGGLRPRFDEPDIVIEVDGMPRGLAIKRLTSLRQVEKRYREACRQIDFAAFPGFVVLDLALALNPENDRIWDVLTDREFFELQKRSLDPFCRRYHPRFVEWRRSREVLGVALLDHVPRPFDRHNWGLSSYNLLVDLDSEDSERRRDASLFWEGFTKGTPRAIQTP